MSARRILGGLLWDLAELTQANESRKSFRAEAYRRAIWALDELDPGLDVATEQLTATPGIGSGVAALVHEFLDSGSLAQLERLRARYPKESGAIRRLPRMTPARLRQLKDEVGVDTTDDLLRAIDSGDVLVLAGVGEATLSLWAQTLDLPPGEGSVPAHRAWVTATALAAHLARHTELAVHVAGEVRRVEEWVDQIDLLAGADDTMAILDFVGTTAVLRAWDAQQHAFETHSGIRGRLHLADPDAVGTALVIATGPESHVAELLGDEPPADHATEPDVYRAHGLGWVPPPARGLPLPDAESTVRVEDLRGDLHLHSERSPDGRLPLPVMFDAALARGYEYVLVSDHTLGLRFGGLGRDELLEQHAEIEAMRPAYPGLTIFHGAEVNIERNGDLDLDEEALSILDFVIAGMHSHFGLEEDEQTDRLLKALAHPSVRVLAHPTGRRIGARPAVRVDLDALIEAAISHDRALESNGHRDRLDLGRGWVRTVLERGARLAANSDAHRITEIDNIVNAVATLQAAGARRESVVNTMAVAEFTAWVTGDHR